MKALFIHYPKCSTCQKAAKWLTENGIDYESRDIVLNNPKMEEMREWVSKRGTSATKFFNTSGLRYKALGLKDVIKTAPKEELLRLLSSEGMLVKRPILVLNDKVLVGFKEKEWSELLQG